MLESIPTPQTCILAKGEVTGAIATAQLVVERKIVALITAKQALLLLLSSFYVFNMHYTEGCLNFYYFLETVVLKKY